MLVEQFVEDRNMQLMTHTENGALTYNTTSNPCVDLFFSIGAYRSRSEEDVKKLFGNAFDFNPTLSVMISLWTRDIREGAGERKVFRTILRYIEEHNPELIDRLIPRVVELGRIDDLLEFSKIETRKKVYSYLNILLTDTNYSALICKWLPRPNKSKIANEIRKHWNLSPKSYRKLLVLGSKTVEQNITRKTYSEIDYSKLPSIAASRYVNHFLKNDADRYKEYLESLKKGESKVNAGAIFPHDVVRNWRNNLSQDQIDLIESQWNSIPFQVSSNMIPVIDVSGSMGSIVSGKTTALDIALALGVFLSSRNTSSFKDCYITFSEEPSMNKLHGIDIIQKIRNVSRDNWGMSTDINKVFNLLIDKVSNTDEELPPIIILSDMEFDQADKGKTNFEAIQKLCEANNKKVPPIIFWNIMSRGSSFPVTFNQNNVCLISGYNPHILKNILSGDITSMTPQKIMLDTVMKERYTF